MKNPRKVIHLEMDGKHFYFGSLKALCEHFGQDKLGLVYTTIRCLGISPEHPYVHPKRGYVIREGLLETTERNKN